MPKITEDVRALARAEMELEKAQGLLRNAESQLSSWQVAVMNWTSEVKRLEKLVHELEAK